MVVDALLERFHFSSIGKKKALFRIPVYVKAQFHNKLRGEVRLAAISV